MRISTIINIFLCTLLGLFAGRGNISVTIAISTLLIINHLDERSE